MSAVDKLCKVISNFVPLTKILLRSEKSFPEAIRILYKARKEQNLSLDFILTTDVSFINNPDTFMFWDEYFKRGMALNNYSFRESLNIKKYLFKRIPDFMKRECLVVSDADDSEIISFIKRNKKVAGKCNLSSGIGFKCYCAGEDNLPTKIRQDKVDLLEGWIEQSEDYAKMNPDSVSALRIHTLRTTKGCQVCLYSNLGIGSRGIIHNMLTAGSARYEVRISNDGKIDFAIVDFISRQYLVDKHAETGYEFIHGTPLPYAKEAIETCVRAAEKIPEFRYIGWDVAFTPDGPIIVEANVLSGALQTMQVMNAFAKGKGLKQEMTDVLTAGLEGIVYDENCNLKAVSFADLSYLEKDNQPNALQQFLVLLENAVHNHGIVFFNVTEENANCAIRYASETNTLELQKGNFRHCLELPEHIPENIFEADKLARQLAEKVYKSLTETE